MLIIPRLKGLRETRETTVTHELLHPIVNPGALKARRFKVKNLPVAFPIFIVHILETNTLFAADV